jgi:hypothetical protein
MQKKYRITYKDLKLDQKGRIHPITIQSPAGVAYTVTGTIGFEPIKNAKYGSYEFPANLFVKYDNGNEINYIGKINPERKKFYGRLVYDFLNSSQPSQSVDTKALIAGFIDKSPEFVPRKIKNTDSRPGVDGDHDADMGDTFEFKGDFAH